MLELIQRFIDYTGIHPETFGRLTVNDARLVDKLRDGQTLTDEAQGHILTFMHNYEDTKE